NPPEPPSRTQAPPPAPTTAATLRSIAPSIFLPALVYEIGNGAIAPIIALTALDVEASPSTAGYMLALLGVGQVLGDVPSASLVDRIGDRHAMIVAAGIAVVALFGCLVAPSLIILGVALIVIGMCNATFYLARQSYVTDVVPVDLRARAMSTLGGSHRIGLFIGPFLGAGAIGLAGIHGAYVVAMIAALAAALLLIVIPDEKKADDQLPAARGGTSAYAVLVSHRRLFATLGFAVLAVGAVRAARQTVLPLWAHHIGLGPEKTSLIFGIASAVDMALFYPAGKVMDRFGRLSIALPSMLILGTATTVLPLTDSAVSLTLVAVIMSFANGIGSGIIMTLGADVAPADNRTRFLSIWRVMSDFGNAAGPVGISIVATAWSLAAGIATIGSAGLLAAWGLAAWAPRYSPYATRAMARERRRATLTALGSVNGHPVAITGYPDTTGRGRPRCVDGLPGCPAERHALDESHAIDAEGSA
ncbi:MAG: major facilitator superfamily 1, partial [Dactylosporangium sp.]|nr:major facilitator superfamily 1 [Dactylosporangium sp.]